MDTSPVALRLLKAIEEYIKESSKKDYRFEIEEQYKIERAIQVLSNQVDNLIKYELERNK